MRRRHGPRAAAMLALALAGTVGTTGLTACADEAQTTTTGEPVPGGEPDHGTVVEGDGWEGALLDSPIDHLQLADGTIVDDATSFVPTEADVRRFEDEVETALADAGNPSGDHAPEDLDGYVRQYTGVEGGGVRHLVVAGICDGAAEDMGWDDGWIEVSDGGTCFWDATMDLATGEIVRFSFHGAA